jgi:hypothetical protein
MYLLHRETTTKIPCTISPITQKSLKKELKKGRFSFDWLDVEGDIYGLYIDDNSQLLGLMSLIDMPHEYRIELKLLELSKENIGQNKRYDRTAGCLIAYACYTAFVKSYGGFVSLTPKTVLISLYRNKYGFQQFGRELGTLPENSKLLIKKYLTNEIT